MWKGMTGLAFSAFLVCLLFTGCSDDSVTDGNDDLICVDKDEDGYGTFCDKGFDCNDADAEHWSDCGICGDEDEDTFYVHCDVYVTLSGPDCDDSDLDNWVSCASCIDADTDGAYVGCDSYENIIKDCDDSDPDNWESCIGCKDTDGDTWFVGCDAYVARNGPDCDDSDSLYTNNCTYCVDNDGDMYYVGSSCPPEVMTDDCDDDDSDVNPGENEICGDGVDQDCDGKDKLPYPDGVPCYSCTSSCASEYAPVCVQKYGTGEYCFEINECFADSYCEDVTCVIPLDEFGIIDTNSPCIINHPGCDTPCSPL